MSENRLVDTGAIVLCGGKSSRMGQPKAWLPFGNDEVMLQRVVRLVSTVVSSVVVVAAPDQEVPDLPDEVIIVRDEVADRGPLQGLAAGVPAFGSHIDYAYATATDVPFLEPNWIRFLRGRIGKHALAIPRVSGYFQPLSALYRREVVIDPIRRLLHQDRLRPAFLLDEVASLVVDEAELLAIDPHLSTIQNLNTMPEYERALARLTEPLLDRGSAR